jgi:hypothetical protein
MGDNSRDLAAGDVGIADGQEHESHQPGWNVNQVYTTTDVRKILATDNDASLD